ncbi:hypothetical protein B0H14DRAFT_3708992 [Mycena olivaceomarginata]|nr:hypothetical protein B0H14DRAFT_3708992 [Mycena olivaceomarginata]
MSAAPELDRSWDVDELHHTDEGFTATCPRPEDRPEARKILLGHYMDEAPDLVERRFKEELRRVVNEGRVQHRHDIEQLAGRFDREHREVVDESRAEYRKHIDRLDWEHRDVVDEGRAEHRQHIDRLDRTTGNSSTNHTERTVVFNDVAEGYEVVTRSLQGMVFGLNNLIFDVERQERHLAGDDVLLTAIEKETLKSHGLGYFSRLLDPPQNLPSDVDALRLKAFNILSPQQQRLCRGLLDVQESDGQRNFLHHPRPDRNTVMDRVGDFLDDEDQNTLCEFLKTDPKRLHSRRERTQGADPDLFLFAREGEYKNVAAQKIDLENLRAERADTAAYLEVLEQKAA